MRHPRDGGGETLRLMRVDRLQSPFKHWLSGLGFEIAVLALFIAVLAGLSALIAGLL